MSEYTEYEDKNFTAGDSPATLDFEGDVGLGELAFAFINDGPGEIAVTSSYDSGSTFGDSVTIKSGEKITNLANGVNQMRLTHTGVDSAYRVTVAATGNPSMLTAFTSSDSYVTTNTPTPIALNTATYTNIFAANPDRIGYKISNDTPHDILVKEKDAADPDAVDRGFQVFKRSTYESPSDRSPITAISAKARTGTPSVLVQEEERIN